MKKSKIYIITECPYVGVFRAIVELSKELKDVGFDISYILPEQARNRYGEKQIDHENVLKKYGHVFHQPLRRKLRYIFGDINNIKSFLSINKPDIVISYTEYAGKVCRILYKKGVIKKLFHVPSCVGIKRKNLLEGFVEYFFETILSKYAYKYLACGASEAYILKNEYSIPFEKIVFLPNLRTFKKINQTKIKYQFIYVGRIIKEKGVFDLLDTLELTGFVGNSLFVGDGKDLEILKKKHPKAKFTGRVSPEKAIELISASRFFISNSVIEGLPYSLIEAMACGVVPIVSDVEGHKDLVINGKNGFLYTKQIDLVNYIFKSQLINAEDYKQMSKSAKETIINLSKIAKKNIRNNFKIYE